MMRGVDNNSADDVGVSIDVCVLGVGIFARMDGWGCECDSLDRYAGARLVGPVSACGKIAGIIGVFLPML